MSAHPADSPHEQSRDYTSSGPKRRKREHGERDPHPESRSDVVGLGEQEKSSIHSTRSRSPRRARNSPNVLSRAGHSGSLPVRHSGSPASAQRRSPSPGSPPDSARLGRDINRGPTHADQILESGNSRVAESRDPRRNQSGRRSNSTSTAIAKSASKSDLTLVTNSQRGNDFLNPPLHKPESTHMQQLDAGNRFITLLGTLVDNASTIAALKSERRKRKVKVEYQESIEKKTESQRKLYPIFAETNSKGHSEASQALKNLDRQLHDHKNHQNKTLTAMVDILQVQRPPGTGSNEGELSDRVEHCLSSHEVIKTDLIELKANSANYGSKIASIESEIGKLSSKLKFSAGLIENLCAQAEFFGHQCSTLHHKNDKLESNFKSISDEVHRFSSTLKDMDDKMTSTTGLLKDLSMQVESFQGQHFGLYQKQDQIQVSLQSVGDEARYASNVLKAGVEDLRKDHQNVVTRIENRVNEALERADSAAAQNEVILGSNSLSLQKLDHLSRLTSGQEGEIDQMRAKIALHHAAYHDGRFVGKKDEGLHRLLREFPESQQAVAALATEVRKLKEELPSSDSAKAQVADDATESKIAEQLVEFQKQLDCCLNEVHVMNERCEQQQKDEDSRDDLIAGRVDKMKQMSTKTIEDFERRVKKVESVVQRRSPADLDAISTQQELLNWSPNTGRLNTAATLPPASASSVLQVHETSQPPAMNQSAQPIMLVSSPEINQRFVNTETAIAVLQHQHNIVTSACQQLRSQYDHLTMEPIVAAIVYQMQKIYPFASTAQREIASMKRTLDSFKNIPSLVTGLEKLISRQAVTLKQSLEIHQTRLDAHSTSRTSHEPEHRALIWDLKKEGCELKGQIEKQDKTIKAMDSKLHFLEEHTKSELNGTEPSEGQLTELVDKKCTKALEALAGRLSELEKKSDGVRKSALDAFRSASYVPESGDSSEDSSNSMSGDETGR